MTLIYFMKCYYFNSDCCITASSPTAEILPSDLNLTNDKARSRRKAKSEIIRISNSVRQSEMRTKRSENESEMREV
jgi:hypothetical protein